MTPRERVLAALDHFQPDRIPLDLGGSFVTAINVAGYTRLRQALNLTDQSRLVREQTQSVIVDEEVRRALFIDVLGLYERPPRPDLEHPGSQRTLTSEWGVTYRQAEGFGAPYTPIATHS